MQEARQKGWNAHDDGSAEPGAGVTASIRPVRIRDAPWPAAIVMATMLVPRELQINVGVDLTPQRVALLVLLPLALVRLTEGRGPRLKVFDWLIISAFTYLWLAILAKDSLAVAAITGSQFLLGAVGGYLVARVYVRTEAEFLAVVRLLVMLVAIEGAMAAVDSLTHHHWVKELARSITGAPSVWTSETRMGLMRSAGTFDHPIHYGAFCAAVFALALVTGRTAWSRLSAATLAAGAVFFSLSSAPLAGVVFAAAAAIYEWITRGFRFRLAIVVVMALAAWGVIAAFSNRSAVALLIGMTFDASNGYYRLAIWNFGSAAVLAQPWFGIPFDDTWARPEWMGSDSVDNYWLATAMNGGLPMISLYCAGIVLALVQVYRRAPARLARARFGWSLAVLVLCFIASTVHYWKEMEVFFCFVLGLGGWLVDAPAALSQPSVVRDPVPSSTPARVWRAPAPGRGWMRPVVGGGGWLAAPREPRAAKCRRRPFGESECKPAPVTWASRAC